MTPRSPDCTWRTVQGAAIPPYRVRSHHDDLLLPAPGPGIGRCDAVIVPSHHEAFRLGFAADLAVRLNCPLVVPCTQGRESSVAAAVRQGPRAAVLGLPHGQALPTFDVRSSREPGAEPVKHRDLSLKRNTALAIARLMRWQTVLLLDDDIRDLDAGRVLNAFSWLTRQSRDRMAGWRSVWFPDNSAVCHAGRQAGNDQGVFIGSGALAVRIDADLPLFPPVYNEDWCFLFESLADRRVILAGDAGQLEYDPFDPAANRGGREEFGDVLGEGLYHLLHCGLGPEPALAADYWQGVVVERRSFINRTRARLQDLVEGRSGSGAGPLAVSSETAALACLDEALRQHRDDLPRQLASFVRSWLEDRERWRSWFAALPEVGSIAEAVAHLGWPPEQLLELPAR